MNSGPRTTLRKKREQHNANKAYQAYHLAIQRKDRDPVRNFREDTSTYILCFPLEQSLTRTTDSGRVIGKPEVNRGAPGVPRWLLMRSCHTLQKLGDFFPKG